MEELSKSVNNKKKPHDKRLLAGGVLICLIFVGTLLSLVIPSRNKSDSSQIDYVPVKGNAKAKDIVVHVAGAVNKQGIVTLPFSARVYEAIEAAGGYSSTADVEYVEKNLNLAARLSDGDKIYIPASGEVPGVRSDISSGVLGLQENSFSPSSTGKIDLNQATVDDLVSADLYRIGTKTAQKIIEYRDQQGGFSSVEELSNIPGIGEKIMEDLRGKLVVQ